MATILALLTLLALRSTPVCLALQVRWRADVQPDLQLGPSEFAVRPNCTSRDRFNTCLFHNLCFDRQRPDSRKLFYFTNGTYLFQRSPSNEMALQLRPPYSNTEWPPLEHEVPFWITIQGVPDPLPDDVAMSPDDTTVLIQTLFEFNFGHLFDSMFMAYRMQRSFDITTNAPRILTYETAEQWYAQPWQDFVSKVFSMIVPDQQVGLQSLKSSFVEQLLKNSSNHKPDARYLCFPNMILGSGPHSFTNPAERSSTEWWAFRNFIIRNFGTEEFSNDIVISRKSLSNRWGMSMKNEDAAKFNKEVAEAGAEPQLKYNHYLTRIAQLQDNLQRSFQNSPVAVVDYAKLPMKDQVLMTNNLKALIAAPGGGSFIALFLPTDASFIVTVDSDLGDDLCGDLFVNEYRLWQSFDWLSFRNVTDMLSPAVEVEIKQALDRHSHKSFVQLSDSPKHL